MKPETIVSKWIEQSQPAGKTIDQVDVLSQLNRISEGLGAECVTAVGFGRIIKRLMPGVKVIRPRTVGEKRKRVYQFPEAPKLGLDDLLDGL